MRWSITLRHLLAVLAVAAVAATCVWAVAQRSGLHAAFSARSQWLARSDPVTGFRDLDAALRQSWMFTSGRGLFPYSETGGKGKVGTPQLSDMGPEELRRAMGRAPSGSAEAAALAELWLSHLARGSAATAAALAEHCYSLHKPKLCPRETKASDRIAPDGSACTNAGEDHEELLVERAGYGGGAAGYLGLLRLTLQASGCTAHLGRPTEPRRTQW